MSDKRTLGESVPEGAWRKFHKVTPLANGGVLWVALAIFLYNILQSLLEDGVDELRDAASHITLMWILIAAGAVVLLTIVVVVCSWVVWRFASFAVVDSGIHHRSGVLIKRHKHMRWDRVQSVEVEQKIFGRIFGFGSVKVESAGSDEGITLGLLTMADCAALRKEVLQSLANARAGRPIGLANDAVAPASTAPAATPGSVLGGQPDAGQPGAANQTGATDHAAGATGATGVVGPDHAGLPGQPDAGQPGETGQPAATGAAPAIPIFDPDDTELDQLIFEMPTSRLIASRLLSPTFLSVLTVTLAMLVGSIWLGETLMAVIFLVVGSAYTFVKSSLGQYGTKVYLSANGLRVRGGLTTLTTRSIPPARLHAIELHRPMLWRWKDWWEVTATLAGAATLDTSGDTPGSEIIIPAGSREEALRVLWTMLPDAGTADDAGLIRDALDGSGTGRHFLSSPDQAKWFDPITYKSRGVCLTPKVAVFRRGRFGRRVMFVWQDHTQSVKMKQGPIQRRLGLGEIELDLVSFASATHKNMAVSDVERMVWVENELSAQARHVGVSESIDTWRERVGV